MGLEQGTGLAALALVVATTTSCFHSLPPGVTDQEPTTPDITANKRQPIPDPRSFPSPHSPFISDRRLSSFSAFIQCDDGNKTIELHLVHTDGEDTGLSIDDIETTKESPSKHALLSRYVSGLTHEKAETIVSALMQELEEQGFEDISFSRELPSKPVILDQHLRANKESFLQGLPNCQMSATNTRDSNDVTAQA